MSSWLNGTILDWRFSQPGFDISFWNLAGLLSLKSCDTTKQSVCGWLYIYIYIYNDHGSGNRGSNTGRVILKIQKRYLMPSSLTLCIISYGSSVKWNDPGKGVAPPTPHIYIYIYIIYIYIYIYIYPLYIVFTIYQIWVNLIENQYV